MCCLLMKLISILSTHSAIKIEKSTIFKKIFFSPLRSKEGKQCDIPQFALFSDIRVCYYPEIVLHLGMYVQIFVTDKKINKQNIGKIWVKLHASVFL